MVRIAIAASDRGTLMEAFFETDLPIKLMIADRLCRALEIAGRMTNLETELIPRTDFTKSGFDPLRHRYTLDFLDMLVVHHIDLLVMAGFKTVFAPVMFESKNYGRRVLNSHPALLPLFPGNNAVRDALNAKAEVTGSTIHIATEVMDDPRYILAQEEVAIRTDDTEDTLHERIKTVERRLYPETVRQYLAKLNLAA